MVIFALSTEGAASYDTFEAASDPERESPFQDVEVQGRHSRPSWIRSRS